MASNRPLQPTLTLQATLNLAIITQSIASFLYLASPLSAAESGTASRFHKDIQPLLVQYCYDCHGEGMSKGKVAFDELKSEADLTGKPQLWSAVLKNLRAGLMPPEKKPRPSAEEKERIANWIKRDALGIDPKNPDPGRVTIRRLNRVEYRNTIRDLMGFDFKAEDELPPDDTGYGFDNIGDVLTVSPMLLEKYMQGAETIVAGAVPRVWRVVKDRNIPGAEFQRSSGEGKGNSLNFYKEATSVHTVKVDQAGDYHLILELEVAGEFDFDPGRCRAVFTIDDREQTQQEFGWHSNKKFRFEFDQKWEAGPHRLALALHPLTPIEKKVNTLDLRIAAVRVQGPLDPTHWVRPKNFDLFFWKDVPSDAAERHQYTRQVLSQFSRRAWRRPADDERLDRLVAIAGQVCAQPGKGFADGVAQAMVAVLASPRFLFRVEDTVPKRSPKTHPLVDEYALASRLSYFLWSTMPDDELFRLAEHGELRKNIGPQAKRMLADKRADALVENFTGQWLQARDGDGIDINARVVLARDAGEEKELVRRRQEFLAQLTNKVAKVNPTGQTNNPGQTNRLGQGNQRRPFFAKPAVELDGPLRKAMRQETEMLFAYVLRQDRSLIEFLESDYTFLNEKLARHYGITNVAGADMRRVTLPKDSPRGGVLTQGSLLVVTSNPTRTSPVKRGLFLLENILGTPTPPPPPDVPLLEDSEKEFKGKEPVLREVLELHRSKPLCSSCHSRMDPLGLALENFNALGMFREKERKQPIDAAGKLITGEPFHDIRELKHILASEHRQDFYRCLTEKLLTYALGRGLEYYDVETVDQIVARLEKENGHSSALLMGIIESAPFQKRRNTAMNRSLDVSQISKPGSPPVSQPAKR